MRARLRAPEQLAAVCGAAARLEAVTTFIPKKQVR